MKGKNELSLNQATMREAVQEYLDARWKGDEFKVTEVRVTTGPSHGSYEEMGFTVTVVGPDALPLG